MRPIYLAWLLGLTAMWQVGCTKPCASTSMCGDDEMCVASVCQALACERTIFAQDPKSGECVPLSGCFLTDEQRTWTSCADDPCSAMDESSCLGDKRCQPFYRNPNVEPRSKLPFGGGDATSPVACAGGGRELPPSPDPFFAAAPGVNNGDAPKYPAPTQSCAIDSTARTFAGCRAAPSIPKLPSCESLKRDACQARRDCSTSPSGTSGGREPAIDLPQPLPPDGQASQFTGECFSRFERPSTDCVNSTRAGCLMNPSCQPIGSSCYCPPGSPCDCDGGDFLGCEPNDRLRRCSSSADCRSDERCDNDEACITPRTFSSPLSSVPPVPGTGSCLGACVPKGCAGLGERLCNENPQCDGGSYGTVCHPKPYCVGGDIGINNEDPARGGGGSCGCDAEFTGCAEQKPQGTLRTERSLLVRDPEIIDDPAFRLDTVLGKLAPAGRTDEFAATLFKQVGAVRTLGNGSTTRERLGYATFLNELSPDAAGLAQRVSGYLHITALVNRLDLAKPGDCGEARLTYALTRAYTDGNQRMTLIVEMRVPDDGQKCRTVAQRWAELSLLDDAAERRTRLVALYNDLLKPENVGQIRTNEFLNRTGKEPWELREFRLNGSGLPELAPVAQTVDKRFMTDSTFLRWANENAAALSAGNAVIPTQYLAASSTEDGGRLRAPALDRDKPSALDKPLNEQACAGCHLTETASPFVHIGERLGKRVGSGYQPLGRAVIDSFLQKELLTRAQTLQQVLLGTRFLLAQPVAATGLARVH